MNTKITTVVLLASTFTLLAACSEDDSKSTGVFVDSPVGNIAYITESQSAFTNASGEFKYYRGESITFKVGGITLPVTPAKNLITPFDLAGTTNPRSLTVINIARLLQTLDTDGNPGNGITISDEAHTTAAGMSVLFDSATFDEEVANLVANSGSTQVSLVPEGDAINHLIAAVEVPQYYGTANYTCRWTSEITPENDDEGENTGVCDLDLSASGLGVDVVVTYSDGLVGYEYEGVMNGLTLTFGGEIEGARYQLSGELVFNESFNTFTGRVSGVGVDENGDSVPFDDVISDGELAQGAFFKVE